MKKVALLILDGWGHGNKTKSDAIFHAKTPFIDSLEKELPNAELLTDGLNVGLPSGQMGNSEVGHLNIGAGRIVYQELTRINKSIEEGEFENNKILKEVFQKYSKSNKKLHFIGLVSDGGVHSSIQHLFALCDIASKNNLNNVYIHAFTDGRDCDPKSGLRHLKNLEKHIENSTIKIASVIGRYYAMDRDKRWERVKKAYDLMVKGEGENFELASESIKNSYENNITDEFIEPKIIDSKGLIEEGDFVISFNFRTDRCREITEVLTQKDFDEYEMKKLNISYTTMTNYDQTYKNINIIFEKENLTNTLGEIIDKNGLNQVRIAETEKYPHVTFFFSGGQETPYKNEKRILINSPKVATYDLLPQMSAFEIRDAICEEINNNQPDFICLNFANADMVGHTGDYQAILRAVEVVDQCTQKVVEASLNQGYSIVIIADHGNSDYAINPDGTPNTAHSLNPVPIIVIDNNVKEINSGILADVAPTILELMNIEKPNEMTGISLIKK